MADEPLIELAAFEKTRATLGADFIRILGYFLEDGEKSVAQIEAAFHARSAPGIVRPAHTLKAEARQVGAAALGELAFVIEMGARRAVETQDDPSDLLVPIARLRPLWNETVTRFERETNPLVQRAPRAGTVSPASTASAGGFGRSLPVDQRFGRL